MSADYPRTVTLQLEDFLKLEKSIVSFGLHDPKSQKERQSALDAYREAVRVLKRVGFTGGAMKL